VDKRRLHSLNQQQVIDRYSTFTVLDSLHVKGDMTVGENTADIAGIAVAYDA
jgi:putative endopeptidase